MHSSGHFREKIAPERGKNTKKNLMWSCCWFAHNTQEQPFIPKKRESVNHGVFPRQAV